MRELYTVDRELLSTRAALSVLDKFDAAPASGDHRIQIDFKVWAKKAPGMPTGSEAHWRSDELNKLMEGLVLTALPDLFVEAEKVFREREQRLADELLITAAKVSGARV